MRSGLTAREWAVFNRRMADGELRSAEHEARSLLVDVDVIKNAMKKAEPKKAKVVKDGD